MWPRRPYCRHPAVLHCIGHALAMRTAFVAIPWDAQEPWARLGMLGAQPDVHVSHGARGVVVLTALASIDARGRSTAGRPSCLLLSQDLLQFCTCIHACTGKPLSLWRSSKLAAAPSTTGCGGGTQESLLGKLYRAVTRNE